MLKWLQSGVYHSSNVNPNVTDIITDDPLATLNFKEDGEENATKTTGLLAFKGHHIIHKEIYSVSRTNPLYEDHILEEVDNEEENFEERNSSTTEEEVDKTTILILNAGGTSSSSSGYSSNRVVNNNKNQHATMNNESIVEIDSLEPDLILDDDDDEEQFEDSIRPIPAPSPIWPSPPPPPKPFIDKDTNFVADITYAIPFKDNHQKNNNDSETPPPNNQEQDSLEVNRNGHFVKAIQWRTHNNRIRPLMGSSMLKSKVPRMLETVLSPIGEVQDDSKLQDSIVTDSLLQMTSFSNDSNETVLAANNNVDNGEPLSPDSLQVNSHQRKEDMDKVIAELTQAVMKSKNITTLQRAMTKKSNSSNNGSDSSRKSTISRGSRLRNSIKSLKNNKGVEAMRELWQQTGMITNGRKLLVDSLSEEEETDLQNKQHNHRKYPKRVKRPGQCRIHPKLSSSSSGSGSSAASTTPPYRQVYNKRTTVSLTSSTEMYAEVYRTSSGESSRSPIYETSVRTVNHSEPVTTTSTSCSNSSESSPLTSSSRPKKQNDNSKSVKFNPEVIDNELTSEKLIYAKLPMASPPKKPTVIIDIAKLNADQGFGFNNKYLITSDNAGSQDYNKDIFDSPYFDYRRTHSTAGSLYSGSEHLSAVRPPRSNNLRITSKSSSKTESSDLFWKGLAIFIIVTLVLAIVISLIVYFIFKSHWLLIEDSSTSTSTDNVMPSNGPRRILGGFTVKPRILGGFPLEAE